MDLRRVHCGFKAKKVSKDAYVRAIKEEISQVVIIQEECDIDSLVHGEPKGKDMVEYFGKQLSGFAFTANGCVQSYGSRCAKPPIIYGDANRPKALIVSWSSMAQSMAKCLMKGMLTEPSHHGTLTTTQSSFIITSSTMPSNPPSIHFHYSFTCMKSHAHDHLRLAPFLTFIPILPSFMFSGPSCPATLIHPLVR
ncbi:hypothetical protein PVL29_003651 [Vitis rotundifolia]|uniref:Cobalamin-independent methionine synthase MetE C-terminal/archaeal domain-containing protein n=1 Tax=Vitis rotundifolia TaxID=103349 RepID=A0AA39AED7_VITRO|nr:hypothetical protein PVL29_003651 [Vitis rotundifolia]